MTSKTPQWPAQLKYDSAVILGLVLFSLAIRLFYMPYASIEDADSVTRFWAGLRWASHPDIYISGVWGPLHFYLIGLTTKIFPASSWAPTILHISFSVATVVTLYVFTKLEFGSSRAAFLAALIWALYPVAIRLSIDVRSETIFVFFLSLSMVFLSLAIRRRESALYAVAAGVCLTCAAALRYEAWMLMPFLGLLLIKKPTSAALFFVFSMIHPSVWMIGNFLHFGDPFYSFNWGSNFELNWQGHALEERSVTQRVERAISFGYRWGKGITPLAALSCILGVLIAIQKKHRAIIWLIPILGLATLYGFAIAKGSLLPKVSYTLVFSLLLLPFSAAFFQAIGIDRISLSGFFGTITACGLMVLVFSFSGEPHSMVFESPIPSFKNDEQVRQFASSIREIIEPDDGLIIDFFGWEETHYLGLCSRVYPDRIFIPPGELYKPFNEEALAEFTDKYPKGVLVLHNESRFADYVSHLNEGERHKVRLELEEIERIAWDTFEDWEKPVRGRQIVGQPQLRLYRYEVVN
jgi:hypothetical protein